MKKNVYAIIAIALVAVLALVGVACSVRAASIGDIMPPNDFENRKALFLAQAWDCVFGDEESLEMLESGKAIFEVTYDDSQEAFYVYAEMWDDKKSEYIEAVLPFNEENCREFDDFDDLCRERNARMWTESTTYFNK